MKRMLLSVRWVFPLAMLLAVGDARAALSMFLEAGKEIQGETKDKEFAPKHAIDVLAWSWGMSYSGSAQAGGGGSAGRLEVQDLSLTKYVDQATPALMSGLAKGSHTPEMKLTVRRESDQSKKYLEITLKEVLVTGLSTGGSGGEDRLTENITLNFASHAYMYTMPDVGGPTTVAVEDLLGTTQGRSVQAPAPKLLANDRSSSGRPMTVTSVSSPSSAGGTVVLSGGLVTYTPPPNFVGLDQWTYTVTDGLSTAQGTVKVTVTAATAQTPNAISIVARPEGNLLQFAGIPGRTYRVEGATNVLGPWQDLSGPIQADPTGLIVFNHQNPPETQFYRTQAVQ